MAYERPEKKYTQKIALVIGRVIYHIHRLYLTLCISDISTLQFILDVICIIHSYNKMCLQFFSHAANVIAKGQKRETVCKFTIKWMVFSFNVSDDSDKSTL